MQNEANDRHQKDGWNDEERSESEIDFEPPAKVSTWRQPIFGAQNEMTQAFHGTLQYTQGFQIRINRWWMNRPSQGQPFIFLRLHGVSLYCQWPFQQLK